MEIFIRAASCISPQQTFGSAELPAEIKSYSGNKLAAIEPDYKVHLNIPSARRMSRLIKMGVCSALQCLKDSEVKIPDAIIVGTGLGCMEDSEKFLASLLLNKEQTLSPTSFIFSTHNTVAAQIALLLQCNNYNFTHTHRGLSFENSLLDSNLFLNDHPQSNILVGATDEVTETSFKILQRLGGVKNEDTSSTSILDTSSPGTIAGEGSAFFLLNNSKHENNLAKITALITFSNPDDENEVSERVGKFLSENKISLDDFILTGLNGDENGDKIYRKLIEEKFKGNCICYYKHLCGDYHTSTAFASWVSVMILKEQHVPDYILLNNSLRKTTANRILIINHYKGREFSLILLEKC